jgi:hypothetical protein
MAYLQVRDFPEELHKQLKEVAKREHRSVSQQTIIAIKEHVAEAVARAKTVEWSSHQRFLRGKDCSEKIAMKRKILDEINAMPNLVADISSEDIIRTIHEGRQERDDRIRL